MQWYVPTFHGDIALERSPSDGDLVLVKVEKLVPSEIEALKKLRTRALKKGWVWDSAVSFPEPTAELTATIELRAGMQDVVDALTAALKPDRTQLSVVRFQNGKMEQVTDANYEKALATGTAAATVATPTQGCPLPDFVQQEIRARRVLAAFLTDEQLADFRKHQAFMSIGADSGHRYLCISRHASRESASFRSLFDVEEQRAYCIHDWTVPAAEELLGLHLHLQVPGMETYMRGVPADAQLH